MDLLIIFFGRVYVGLYSSIRRWRVEDPCRASGSIPVQVPQHWFHEQDIPSEYR